MTDASSGMTGTGTTGTTTDEARHEAARVADESKDAGRRVVDTAKHEAARVADEAKGQARKVYHEVSGELQKQASEQQHRAAEGLRSMGQEFESMAQSSEQQGMASNLAHQAARRIDDVAGWLERSDAQSMVDGVKNFARTHPGTFIAIAAGTGLIIGRFLRASTSDPGQKQQTDTMPQYEEPTPVYEETVAEYEMPATTTAGAAPGTTPPVYGDVGMDGREVRG